MCEVIGIQLFTSPITLHSIVLILSVKEKNLVKKLLEYFRKLQSCRGGPLSSMSICILESHADKARDFIGKGRLGRELEGEGTQENCSATWLTVSGFMVMELVSQLFLANHADS